MSKTMQWIIVWLLIVNIVATVLTSVSNVNISQLDDFNHNRILKEIDELKENDADQMLLLHMIQAHFWIKG
jgi:hypothetical protein